MLKSFALVLFLCSAAEAQTPYPGRGRINGKWEVIADDKYKNTTGWNMTIKDAETNQMTQHWSSSKSKSKCVWAECTTTITSPCKNCSCWTTKSDITYNWKYDPSKDRIELSWKGHTYKGKPRVFQRQRNVCKCTNGTEANGVACTSNGARICASCNTGYSLQASNKSCQPKNVCKCDGGSPAKGKKCTNDGYNICAYCSAGYIKGGVYCDAVECPQHSVGNNVPTGCKCSNGFHGTIQATKIAPYYSGKCKAKVTSGNGGSEDFLQQPATAMVLSDQLVLIGIGAAIGAASVGVASMVVLSGHKLMKSTSTRSSVYSHEDEELAASQA